MNHVDNPVSLLASEGAAVQRTPIVRGDCPERIHCSLSECGNRQHPPVSWSFFMFTFDNMHKIWDKVDNKIGSGKSKLDFHSRTREGSNDRQSF